MAEERRVDDPLASWNQPHIPKNKKNTRKWCRGKEGTEHSLHMVLYHEAPCRWHKVGDWKFSHGIKKWFVTDYFFICSHWMQCKRCGKYVKKIKEKDCPDMTDKPSILKEKV